MVLDTKKIKEKLYKTRLILIIPEAINMQFLPVISTNYPTKSEENTKTYQVEVVIVI